MSEIRSVSNYTRCIGVCVLTTRGTKGGLICRASSFCQFRSLKNGCCLIDPWGLVDMPRRIVGFRSSSCSSKTQPLLLVYYYYYYYYSLVIVIMRPSPVPPRPHYTQFAPFIHLYRFITQGKRLVWPSVHQLWRILCLGFMMVTLTFDLLTFKRHYELHMIWTTCVQNVSFYII